MFSTGAHLRQTPVQSTSLTESPVRSGASSSNGVLLVAALFSVPPAAYAGCRTRDLLPEPVGMHPSVSRLEMPAPWLAELSADLGEVMNAESLELQAIFNSDHLKDQSDRDLCVVHVAISGRCMVNSLQQFWMRLLGCSLLLAPVYDPAICRSGMHSPARGIFQKVAR
ncbi:g9733 [Coccomyxa viridis]|uniref:G9733 protein n=1 Tax=Coccomyxa viridis TaxID=1274662 RepID=A0ABP1G6C2_9CHLO